MGFFKKSPTGSSATELSIPPDALASDNARELLRVRAAGGKQHVSLATEMWDDPAAWGIMLVDLVRHVAGAYQQTKGFNTSKVMARIKAGFDAEWDGPTDKPTGSVLK